VQGERRVLLVQPGDRTLRLAGRETVEQLVEAVRHRRQGPLVRRFIEGHQDLLERALAQHEDEAGQSVADLDEVEAAEVGGAWLGRRRDARGPGDRGQRLAARRNQCSLANSTWPNWCLIISCSTAGRGTMSVIASTKKRYPASVGIRPADVCGCVSSPLASSSARMLRSSRIPR
jgi:hypothetical protein